MDPELVVAAIKYKEINLLHEKASNFLSKE